MTPKELKKLVKVCRDMGVKSYKGDGFEFTLTDDLPVKSGKKLINNSPTPEYDIESDTLTPEELLFWSADIGVPPTIEDNA